MSREWETASVGGEYDYISPGGSAEIRLLPSFEQGEFAHARAMENVPSRAATIVGAGELFYVLTGEGELWRRTADLQDITPLVPRRCVSIPPGIDYQFRALGGPMDILIATAPRWRRDNWAEAETCWWADDGKAIGTGECRPGPWVTVDLASNYDYLAPDGSEIRLLPTYDAGGLAHCRLPATRISVPVRHRTVVEIWYVLAGRGEVWRANDEEEEVVQVKPSSALTIPLGVSFQFRASNKGALEILIGTFPRWPGAAEAEPADGRWARQT
jgi:mannose-6-phosphate isomerase-like protein (cupin superfamily)